MGRYKFYTADVFTNKIFGGNQLAVFPDARGILGRKSFWVSHLYIFCFAPERQGSDLRARMFAPAMGIEEDPATGAVASALAEYLGVGNSISNGVLQWRVEQGFEMGRPSMLNVQAEKGGRQIIAVMVSEGFSDLALTRKIGLLSSPKLFMGSPGYLKSFIP